ncbi:MAG: hypothetical protein LBU16_04615 [Treponema sp.]|jgi:hypothetical protein|nr:hypothetical protein [Treponema sp.]
MAKDDDWREELYAKTYSQEMLGLERRRAADPGCAAADIEGTLRSLYTMEGADWLGRGEVQDIAMAATIAAYEHTIAKWRAGD